MGLLAGISTLSILEIFYHLVVIKMKQKSTQVKPTVESRNRAAWVDNDHALIQLLKYFGSFFTTSDMHGAHYILDQKVSKSGRIFWTGLLILSIATCSYLVSDMIDHADESPIATKIETMPADKVSRR